MWVRRAVQRLFKELAAGKKFNKNFGTDGLESPVDIVVMNIVFTPLFAGVAQQVERFTCNEDVAGSIPVASSIGLGSSLQLPQGVKSL